MNRPTHRPRRPGFTLVELLVVMVILGLLVALLVPAIGAAVRRTKEGIVAAEINQLANALAQFKSRYGDYPPSRIWLCENGFYNTSNTTPIPGASSDITYGQLAQRSVTYIRKFWPKVQVSTTGVPGVISANFFYDFNGNGIMDSAYIIQGHECLVFFIGGIPSNGAVTGFAKNPQNPFTAAGTNRDLPMFEFKAERLFLDPTRTPTGDPSRPSSCGIPGYVDSFGNSLSPGNTVNFYAYFSAYGSNNYDPNDVNFAESDSNGVNPVMLSYNVGFPTSGTLATSPGPNPYTTSLTVGPTGTNAPFASVNYQNPQSFQIISSGVDGQYGPGGFYGSSSSNSPLPNDPSLGTANNVYNSTDQGLRRVERDNITNFKAGRLD
jgi:prepilin-type N-terminal cleavage/methylation domain-containing protein